MNRPQCSYWIDITGTEEALKAVETAMDSNPTIKEDFYKEVNEYGELHYEVSDGTIEQWTDMEEDISKIAALVPDCVITVDEIDEESHNFHILRTFLDGRLDSAQHGRQLDPDQYDIKTAELCIKLLTDAGMIEAAEFLKGKYIGV